MAYYKEAKLNNVARPVSWTPKLSDSEKVSNLVKVCWTRLLASALATDHSPLLSPFTWVTPAPLRCHFFHCLPDSPLVCSYGILIGLASLPTLGFTTLYCNCIFHYFKNVVKHLIHKSIKKNTETLSTTNKALSKQFQLLVISFHLQPLPFLSWI